MKLWPFGRKRVNEEKHLIRDEVPTIDRLLAKDCNRDEFVLLYVKLLQERMPDVTMEMTGETAVRMIASAGKEATTFLDNAWLAYQRNEEDRREMLERYVRVAASLHEPSDEFSPERVVAMVKDSQYMSMFKPEHDPAAVHLCGDLWIVYAEDMPDKMRSLKRCTLQKAGISEDRWKDLAVENLRRLIPELQRHGEGPWFLLTAGGDYTASLLLFDGIWDDLAESVDGDIVAVAPARDVVLYTGSGSMDGLAAIRERAAQIATSGSYAISDTLLVRTGGRWSVFKAN